VSGRAVILWSRQRDVALAWGDEDLLKSLRSRRRLGASVTAACTNWACEGRGAPQRVGAFWPGRFRFPGPGFELSAAARQALNEDPPIVWWGWTDSAGAHDSIQWSDLPKRVHEWLDAIPLGSPRIP
jgi:hypothetical protein